MGDLFIEVPLKSDENLNLEYLHKNDIYKLNKNTLNLQFNYKTIN